MDFKSDTVKQSRAQKREQAFHLIENYLSSGEKQKEFCTENSINYHNFRFWLKQYQQHQQDSSGQIDKMPVQGFIPLQPQSHPHFSYPCIIEAPNGLRITFERVDMNMLRELLNLTTGL